MCTLTWTTRGYGSGGYALWFNRDERLTRAPERPPTRQRSGGVDYVAPEDSEAGGTWIAANEHGITVAVLNGYVNSLGPSRDRYESRGSLVRALAGIQSVREVYARLGPRDLAQYRPVVLLVKQPGFPALVARWDGLTVRIDGRGERQLPLTSSSYEQDEVQRSRAALYRSLVTSDDDPPADQLRAFHDYDGEGQPSAFSPTMRRDDAATRSQCRIEVDERCVQFEYESVPRTSRDPVTLELPRVESR